MSKVFSAVGNAIGGVVKAVGNVVSGVVSAIGKVASAVVNFVVSPFMSLFGVPDVPSAAAEAERQQGVLFQQQGSNVNVPIVYGYRKVAGTVVFAETGSTNNKYLWVAYVFSEGPVEGLHQLYIDDNQLPDTIVGNLNAGQTVDITTGKYANRVKLQWYPGVYSFSNPAGLGVGANSILKESPSWKSSNYFNGLAVLFARYEWKEIKTQEDADNNPFQGNIPQVQIALLGMKVASLTVSDPAGQGEWETAPIRYSTNPAEIVLDYLRSTTYGKGLRNSEIDWDSFKVAATKCNTQVTYVTGITGPVMTCNYVVDTGQSIFNNVKTLLTNMRGYLPYVQGKYKLKIEDAGNPTDITSGSATIAMNFNKDNITGAITYTGIDRSSKYNQVVVTYIDPDNKWSNQQVTFPEDEATRQIYVTQDGGREYKGEFTFGAITNYAIAKDMARLIWYKSRFQDTCSFKADSRAFELEPGDCIYISSNILDFGTNPSSSPAAIPWRIVSLQLNNDYTFNVGCVRNPDFMYPYTRVGEIDIALPTYIPKGASIEYPRTVRVPLGLKPPTRATAVSGFTGTTSNPAPTDPTGTTGGGNGGTTNAVSPNTPPAPPPVIKPLDNVIKIDKASYVVENGQIYATLEFLQPDHPMYSGVILYYKRNIASDTYWRTYDSTVKPGANQLITVKIGPLLNAPYSVKTRVKYSTGDSSTLIGTSSLNVTANTNENPTDYVEVAVAGWSLVTTPPPNPKNTFWAKVTGTPLLSGGHPTSPRTLQLTLTQDISKNGINGYVAGAKIYYKSHSATYWSETTYTFAQPYVEGTAQTFTIPASFGVPTYPGDPGSADQYDFIIRAQYIDLTESLYQYRIMDVPVEYNGSYSFDPFLEKLPASQGIELASAYEFVTVANSPPGSVTDPRDSTIGLLTVEDRAPGSLKIFFNPPNVANRPYWYGMRVYKRVVNPGANPAFESIDISPITAGSGGEWSFSVPVTFDQVYEFVLVPLVEYSGKVEATTAWYGQGYVHNRITASDYPSTGNWLSKFNWASMPTSTALNQIKTTFPQTDPTVQVSKWARVQLDNGAGPYGQFADNWYYQLTFSHQHISNYNELHVYRRSRNSQAQPTGTSQYYGIGRWEKVTVTTTNGSGTVTINLRPSIGYQEFNPYGTASGSGTTALIASIYGTNKPLSPTGAPSGFDEFLLVVKSDGAVSAKALLLPTINRVPLTTRVDGLNVNKPVTVTVADYNNYTASWLRNLSESRTPVSASVLLNGSTVPNQYPVPTTTPTIV